MGHSGCSRFELALLGACHCSDGLGESFLDFLLFL